MNTIPSIGRIVHATIKDERGNLVIRPAIIVRVWNEVPSGSVNLQVFADSDAPTSDYNDGLPNVFWVTSAIYQPEAGKMEKSWSWPPRV